MDRETIQKAYRTTLTAGIYYGMRAIVGVATLFYIIKGDWSTALATFLVFVLMMLPSILNHRYKVYLPFALEFGSVLLIFLSLYIGGIQHYYKYIELWDKLLHFQSGLILAVAGFVVVYLLNETRREGLELSPLFVAIFAAVFAIALGAFWEIGEFTGDSIFHTHWQIDNTDTMWDIIADTIGALIVSSLGYIWMRYESRIPFTPRFLRSRYRGSGQYK